MQDASAREVVGGLWGARFHLGNFDACLSTGAGSPVGARYCLVQLSPDVPAHVLQDRSLGHCNGPHATMWDRVPDLDPNSDALPALQVCISLTCMFRKCVKSEELRIFFVRGTCSEITYEGKMGTFQNTKNI